MNFPLNNLKPAGATGNIKFSHILDANILMAPKFLIMNLLFNFYFCIFKICFLIFQTVGDDTERE